MIRDSSVGVTTGHGLDYRGTIPVRDKRLSLLIASILVQGRI
jgi:hypothetical protein